MNSGTAGGYGGGPTGGMPGAGMPGAQQGGGPVDHQQQQQQMMMARQQQMYLQHQQQQAAAARGMIPPGMQQHPAMMQQQNMYGMQQSQPGGGGAVGMDPAQMARYQQQAAARQQQMQQQQQQQPSMHQQQMLEKLRNMPPDERNARLYQMQQQQMAAAAARGPAYPPGMQPGGGTAAHMNAMGGHMGGPQQQQPGSSGMGMSAAAASSAAGAAGGSGQGGAMPNHFIKQEPLAGSGSGMGGGSAVTGGAVGMMGGGQGGGAPSHMMNIKQEGFQMKQEGYQQMKQEQGLRIKQEPGIDSSSSMGHHPGMQQMQHPGGGPTDDSSNMQHMQQVPQGMPVNAAQMQRARQAAAMRQQQAAAAAAASMQGGVQPGQDMNMTVQQHLAAKNAAAAAAAGGHPNMQQQPQSMQSMDMHQRMIFQQHQQQMLQQQQQQQQGMTMAQMQAAHHARQQMAAPAAAAAGAAAGGAMGPPPVQQQQPQSQPTAAAAPSVPAASAAQTAAAAAAAAAVDEEEVKMFKKRVDALKDKYGSVVERFWNRATPGETMPRFITVCKELFSGARGYTTANMSTVGKLEKDLDIYLERQSVTAGILQALDSVIKNELEAKEKGDATESKPSAAAAAAAASSRLLPDPWPLDVRARRVRVPDGLARHVRSLKMDSRLISRSKRHRELCEEEGQPLWSARRMRHDTELDKELEELDRVEGPGEMNGVPCKITTAQSLPPAVVNSIPKSEGTAPLKRKRAAMIVAGGKQQRPRLNEDAEKELNGMNWRVLKEERTSADSPNYIIAIAVGEATVPPLHVLIPFDYPSRQATVLFEKSFPKSHGPLRRLGELTEARLATVPSSLQGRVFTMTQVYKAVCEDFLPASKASRDEEELRQLQQHFPSPPSSTSTSPAEQPVVDQATLLPLSHNPPTTFRPQAKFRTPADNAKSRMVY